MAGAEHAGSQFKDYMDQAPGERRDVVRETMGEFSGGPIRDGHSYTGMSVIFQHPKTGQEHVGWSGELHGTWGGDHNPALDMLKNVRSWDLNGVAHKPTYAVFHSQHPTEPSLPYTRTLHLPTADLRYRER